jgi:hypothetical protein
MLAGTTDKAGLAQATKIAIKYGVPVLLTPKADDNLGQAALRLEIQRLAPATLVTFGAAAKAWAQKEAAFVSPGATVESADPAGAIDLTEIAPVQPLAGLTVLAKDTSTSAAAIAVARASGARVLVMKGSDPRGDGAAIKALHDQPADHVVAIGSAFGPAERLRARVATAATGVTLPGGGQLLFPGHRMIALYGHPGDGGLGVLGEQGVTAAVARAKRVAASYEPYLGGVVPAFEIITTVASSSAGSDGDYSRESSVASLKPWVDAARKAGVYVMLDLQPGRTDFLTQAKRYEKLLLEPHVGLALDPEWRLKKDQVHLEQIGSVSSAEINRTGEWLAQLTREHHLPQKIFMVHQFTLKMIGSRSALKTNYDELAVVIHADGFGSRGAKFNTWNALHVDAPKNIDWGWKNFYDEDKPTFTPKQTSAVRPTPVFISYQ